MPNIDHEELKKRLSVKLHENDIRELCSLCADRDEQEFLYQLMFEEDKRVGDNAAWVLNHLTKDDGGWLVARRDELIDAVMKTPSTTRRRFILSLLERMDFPASKLRKDFLEACFAWLMSNNEPPGVRTFSMKIAYKLCFPYPELLAQLRSMLEQLDPSQLSMGVKCARRKILS